MNKKNFLFLLSMIFINESSLGMNWEAGLRILYNQNPSTYLSDSVFLYRSHYGTYYELYRSGKSKNYAVDAIHKLNAVFDVLICDITNNFVRDSLWEPINTGDFILRIGNWCINLSLSPPCPQSGEWDFIIQFIRDNNSNKFALINGATGVSLVGEEFEWDKVLVTFNQLNNDGTTSIGDVTIIKPSSPPLLKLAPLHVYLTKNTEYLFEAETVIRSNQKYINWVGLDDIKNFRKHFLEIQDYSTTSRLNFTYSSVSIKNNFIENTELNPVNDIIYFKDPWLIDYGDPNYGYRKRNRGMDTTGVDSLIFKSRPSPFYPDYTTSYNGDVYKGVFLNQSGPSYNWQPPYYSVKVDAMQDIYLQSTGRTHRFYFQNWSASPQGSAQFKSSNALETGNF